MWRELSDEQRELIRERYQEFRDLSPEERDRVRAAFQSYRDLSPSVDSNCVSDSSACRPNSASACAIGLGSDSRSGERKQTIARTSGDGNV